MFELIEKLCAVCAPTGREADMRDALCGLLKGKCELLTDNSGNLIAHRRGEGKRIMITAPMDEPSFIVKSGDKGFSKLDFITRVPTSALLGKQLRVGEKTGTAGITPIHLDSERDKLPKTDSVYFDFPSAPEPGSFGCFCGGAERFGRDGGLIRCRAAGSRALLAVLLMLADCESSADLWLVFAAKGNISAAGALTAASTVLPEYAIILSTIDNGGAFDLSAKPRLALPLIDSGAVHNTALVDSLKQAAEKAETETYLPKDRQYCPASALAQREGGIKTAALLLPIRLKNTDAEYFRLADAEGAQRLLAAALTAI